MEVFLGSRLPLPLHFTAAAGSWSPAGKWDRKAEQTARVRPGLTTVQERKGEREHRRLGRTKRRSREKLGSSHGGQRDRETRRRRHGPFVAIFRRDIGAPSRFGHRPTTVQNAALLSSCSCIAPRIAIAGAFAQPQRWQRQRQWQQLLQTS